MDRFDPSSLNFNDFKLTTIDISFLVNLLDFSEVDTKLGREWLERKKVCFKRNRIGKGMVKPKTKYLFGEPGENTWGERLPEISAIT